MRIVVGILLATPRSRNGYWRNPGFWRTRCRSGELGQLAIAVEFQLSHD